MAKTPKSVKIVAKAPPPVTDPTLGVAVGVQKAAHRGIVWCASVIHSPMGSRAGQSSNRSVLADNGRVGRWDGMIRFRPPPYDGYGGLPLNLEFLIRGSKRSTRGKINWWEFPSALFFVRSLMDEIEDYWSAVRVSPPSSETRLNHNLGVYGWGPEGLPLAHS